MKIQFWAVIEKIYYTILNLMLMTRLLKTPHIYALFHVSEHLCNLSVAFVYQQIDNSAKW